jgi:hypothetical protein
VGKLRFNAQVQPRGPAAAVVLDAEQVAAVGEGAQRFPVRAVVNGYEWRTVVARMRGESLLGLSRKIRESAGVEIGQSVAVELELDREPREVEVPAELAAALQTDADAQRKFDALAPSHRKEFARWVAEAKRAETRERRAAQALAMIARGERRS